MILNRRIIRELKGNIVKYGALFFLIVLGMSVIISIIAASESIVHTVTVKSKENYVEDGEFNVFAPLSEAAKTKLADGGVLLEETFYIDFDMEDSSILRIFKNRENINLIALNTGNLPQNDREIVLEEHYAKKHNYNVDSLISIGKVDYTVCGIGTVPDYALVKANASDSAADTNMFSIAFVTSSSYEELKDNEYLTTSEEYNYTYILQGDMTVDDLKSYLADLELDTTLVTNKYMREIVDNVEEKKDNIVTAINNLADGSDEVNEAMSQFSDSLKEVEAGAQDLYSGSTMLLEGMGELSDSLKTLSDNSLTLTSAATDVFDSLISMVNNSLSQAGIQVRITRDNYNSSLSDIGNASVRLSDTQAESINNLKQQLDSYNTFYNDLKTYTDGVYSSYLNSQSINGAEQLTASLRILTDGNANLNLGADTIFNSLLALASSQLSDAGIDVALTKSDYASQLNSIKSSFGVSGTVQNSIEKLRLQLDNYNTFYEGLNEYTEGVKSAYKGADELYKSSLRLNENIELLKDSASEISDKTTELYGASADISDGIHEIQGSITNVLDEYFNVNYDNLTSFLEADNNTRINGYKDQERIYKTAGIIVGIMFTVLFAYIVSVFIVHNIDNESVVIGALYSLGYKKRELLNHFLILPISIISVGGIVGTIVGFCIMDLQTIESTSYFSYPDVERVYPIYLILYGIFVPIIIAVIVNVFTISHRLSKAPLSMLRKEKKQHRISMVELKNMKFINKYRVRQIIREARSTMVLFVGLFIAILLMMFGFTIYSAINNLSNHIVDDVKFQNMYLLKFPPNDIPEGAEKCYTKSLETNFYLTGKDLEVTLLGIEDGNKFFNFTVDGEMNEIYISSSAAIKFNWKKGDKIVFTDNLENRDYAFSVKDIVQYSNGLYVFMNLSNMQKLFGQDTDYYNTLLSDSTLDIENGRTLSVTSVEDMIRDADVFMNNMKSMIIMVVSISIIIFVIVINILLKLMIDKSTFSISLIKIFGYNEKEINKMYLGSNLYTVLVSMIMSIPVGKIIVDKIYPFLVSDMLVGFDTSFTKELYFIVIAIIMGAYFIVETVLRYHLKKISLSKILKNRE